jgi:gamma-tubulin complex component 2
MLDSSDFLTQFMDLSADELVKRKDGINLRRLQYLWDLCTGGKAMVEIQLSSRTFLEQLMKIIQIQGVESDKPMIAPDKAKSADAGLIYGVDSFSLTIVPEFPAALIINSKAILKYQLIFRHMFNCKYVERILASVWLLQTKRKAFGAVQVFDLQLAMLGSNMLELVRHVLFYMGCEVVEPRWKEMETKLLAASTVDQVLVVHNNFLDTCLKECMLSDASIISVRFGQLTNVSRCFQSCCRRASSTASLSSFWKKLTCVEMFLMNCNLPCLTLLPRSP